MAQLFHLSGRAYENSSGVPYPLAKAYFYVTGTTTLQDTYNSASLAVANANPVVAGADGVFGDIYLAAKRYKVVVKDADDNPLRTWDPIDATSQLIAASAAPSPTYPFLRYHNTTDGFVYRRNAADNAWINEGAVDSVGNTASVTEVLTGTETAKFGTPDSIAALWQRGTTITPSAGTVSLPSAGGGVYTVAAGNFSAISTAQGGRIVVFEFSGVSVITHNGTSLDLPGNADITTAAGDRAAFVNLAAQDASGSNWRMLWGTRDDGSYIGVVATQAQQETGTNLTFPVTPGRQHFHDSALKGWIAFNGTGTPTATDQYNFVSGSSGITDNGAGDYTLTFTTAMSTAAGYAAVGMCNSAAAGNVSAAQMCARGPNAGNVLAASIRVDTGNANTGANTDEEYVAIQFAGDL